MAITFVQGKWTEGTVNHSEETFAAAGAGNLLVSFVTKSTEPTVAPTVTDDKGATWTVHATHAEFNTSAASTWVAYKKAAGGETKVKATGGTITGVTIGEFSGASTTVDKIETVNNAASTKTLEISGYPPVGTTEAGDLTVIGIGATLGTGEVEAWTGTGPAVTNPETRTNRTYFGYTIPGAAIEKKSFIAHHATARAGGMLAVSFKAESGGEPANLAATLTMTGNVTAKANQSQGTQATLSASVQATTKATDVVGAKAVVTLVTTVKAAANEAQKLAAALGYTMSVQAQASLRQALRATTGFAMVAVATPRQAQKLAATTGFVIAASAKLTASGGVTPTTKKIYIFVFDE